MWISTVTCGEDTCHVGAWAMALYLNVSLRITLYVLCKEVGVWLVTNSQEETINSDMTNLLLRRTFLINKVSALYLGLTREV